MSKEKEKDIRQQIKLDQKGRHESLPLINTSCDALNLEVSAEKTGARFNAVKHGVFSKESFLSEEELNEFELQHEKLIAEYKPDGASGRSSADTCAVLRT